MFPPPLKTEAALGEIRVAGDLSSALPLEHTAVTIQVTGPLACVAVIQRFGNPLDGPAELEYLFPLPPGAAIIGFELRAGSRVIRGDVQEVEQARQAYEAAREEGKRAGLLEQRRPNLFAVRLANLLPGETIQAAMRYQERIKFEDGSFEFVFPMGVTPRYTSPQNASEALEVAAPLAEPGEAIGPVEISLAVDAGTGVGEPASPTHPLEVTRLDERRFQVRVAGETIPDHDFILRYPLAGERVAAAGWNSPGEDGETFLAVLFPPAIPEEYQAPARDFIFVLDRSGSMLGQPIVQARNALRACLRALNGQDTFRILLFDDQVDWYRGEPGPAAPFPSNKNRENEPTLYPAGAPKGTGVTQAAVDQADAFLDSVQGRGGTEIIAALEAVLDLPADPTRTRYIVFLTDGAVSAEARALQDIRRRLGKSRLFTFGIGPSVNRALLSQIARVGRGAAEFLQLDEDIEGAILRFQDRVGFPMLTGLRLEWENARAWDVHPALLPDLYAGQPLEISGRLKRSGKEAVSLKVAGRLGEAPVTLELALPPAGAPDPAIRRVWARACVDELLDRMDLEPHEAASLRAQVISLSLENQLVTPYTAFVAVDQEVAVRDGKARLLRVAQPLPQGLLREGFESRQAFSKAVLPSMPHPSTSMPPSASPRLFQSMKPNLSSSSGLELPEYLHMEAADSIEAFPALPIQVDPEEALRWLARTQDLDGSWGRDVERTAAGLLAFVRAGHTTRTGSFRQVVRRASEWLAAARRAGFGALLGALALEELARATGQAAHQASAAQARAELPPPASPLEKAVLGLLDRGQPAVTVPDPLQGLDDLRLAAAAGESRQVPAGLLSGPQQDLVRALAAAMQPALHNPGA